jgi:hypothetical protein
LASRATAATFMASFLISPWTPWSSTAKRQQQQHTHTHTHPHTDCYYLIHKSNYSFTRLTVANHLRPRSSPTLWYWRRHLLENPKTSDKLRRSLRHWEKFWSAERIVKQTHFFIANWTANNNLARYMKLPRSIQSNHSHAADHLTTGLNQVHEHLPPE